VEAGGTPVEVFALPGHTPGSAAFLVHGVLFLGDSAAAASDGSFQPNTMLGTDPEQTTRSIRALAERLRNRASEIRHLAFGHQGALEGLQPMVTWHHLRDQYQVTIRVAAGGGRSRASREEIAHKQNKWFGIPRGTSDREMTPSRICRSAMSTENGSG
jgi:glyoxylase-like metal-dependent hydrolase (beta-lactamase superfamily II)